MSMDFAGSFINALQAGQQAGQQRRRQNALMGAGQMAASGNAGGGVNALLRGGYWDDAAQLTQFGDRQRKEQTRERVTQAMQGAQGGPMAQMQAGAGAALAEGDTEQWAAFTDYARNLRDDERAEKARQAGALSNAAASVLRLPEAQRGQALQQQLQAQGLWNAETQGQFGQMKFDDASLTALAEQSMTAAEILSERTRVQENADAIKREDERYRQQRQDRLSMLGGRGGGGGQGFDPTNPTGVRASAEQRGRIALSLGNVISAQNQLTAIEKSAQQNPEVGFTRQGPNAKATPLGNDWGARIAEAIPFDGGTTARIVGGESYAQYETASRTFEQSILPAFAGSAVTESEAKRFVRSNLPRLGDSPAILQQKAENRARIVNAAASMVGAEPPYPEVGIWQAAAPEQQQTPTQQTQQTQASRAPASNAQLPDPSEFLPGTVIQIGNERYTLSGDGRSWTKQGSQGFRGTENRPANGMR